MILDLAQVDGEERGLVEEDVDVELPQDLPHVDAALGRGTLLGLLLPHLHDLVRDRVAAEGVLAGGRRDVEARSEERGLDEARLHDDEPVRGWIGVRFWRGGAKTSSLGASTQKKDLFPPSVCAENQGRPRRWGSDFLVRVV